MRKLLVWIILVLYFVTSTLTSVASFADTSDVEKEIEELKQKITNAQNQERSLSSEIAGMDRSIKLTTLQINETQIQIDQLEQEIIELTDKIGRLETALTRLSQLLINRIVTTYKVNRVPMITLLFSSNGITDFLTRAKYLQLAQVHDREVMTEVQMTKVNFSEQKTLRETKKQQQEVLKTQLEAQKAKLNEQKKVKAALLEQTRNDEATYQKLLQQALAEKQAIEAALVSGEKVGPIKKGDPIALVGNTGYPGCSTGTHLHFEIRKNNQWVNPEDYLKSRSVADQQNEGSANIGHGDWDWPIDGDVILTQHYGHTPYSWRYTYSGGIHTGLDMYSGTSAIIRAPKDGTLFSASQNCSGSTIKIKYIEHGDGLVSLYLHVQ